MDAPRIDKWLWAARFFKTRGLAQDAIDGGHVHINGDRPKPARTVKLGDRIRVRNQSGEYEIVVEGLSDRRGPATEARTLYRETEESLVKREREAELKALAPQFDHPDVKGRPTKKLRRQIDRFNRD
ncbi:RNA-binding S4 domain-containing protein [Parachitinimonas caeni]|uniref:RNA-binding S4 domain-containing protein n=1 Tax=Parachitinimonas caeni TaxID=3031301 RepID=A0ABT7DTD6_9NEIS|nr:RNA-binding S4 domain-containing protein [Parachitinimonas caeni]MDK2123336.1 RNA-binding S4 domain-containing protein [Parachitinimonas caeni]